MRKKKDVPIFKQENKMIEIKITIDDALQLLLERMKFEMKMRQKIGFVSPESELENLSFKELKSIVDAAIFDTLFLLPGELITGESNLSKILTATVRILPKILHREEFYVYDEVKATNLIKCIKRIIRNRTVDNAHLQN